MNQASIIYLFLVAITYAAFYFQVKRIIMKIDEKGKLMLFIDPDANSEKAIMTMVILSMIPFVVPVLLLMFEDKLVDAMIKHAEDKEGDT